MINIVILFNIQFTRKAKQKLSITLFLLFENICAIEKAMDNLKGEMYEIVQLPCQKMKAFLSARIILEKNCF